jgi:hypothetical protein
VPSSSASSPAPGARELSAGSDPLEPGTYTHEGFIPRVEFDVPAGWSAQQFASGFFDVQQRVGTPDVIAVQFARILAIADGRGGSIAVHTPQEVLAALARNTSLHLTDQRHATLAGQPAEHAVVQTTDPVSTDPPVFRAVLDAPAGPISIASARRLALTVTATPEGLFAVLVGGSVAHWAETLRVSEPVVASVRLAG